MKKLFYMIALIASSVMMAGCEDFLDSEDYTGSNTGNFPANAADAEKMLTAVYSTLNQAVAKPQSTYFFVSELACDDRLGGGGVNDKYSQAIGHLMYAEDNQFDDFWTIRYRGIFRANSAIEGLIANESSFSNEELFNQCLGEAYFLRAYFYHELAEMFGPVPLITSTTQETNVPRADIDDIYAQIAADLKQAINLMSNRKYNEFVEAGHATKWAAEALMARVFLFYTGFYAKEVLPLKGEDGTLSASVTKAEVIEWVDDCVDNSGHDLLGDYRNLWPYTNEFTVDDYAYTKDAVGEDGNSLKWAGNGNEETVFAIKFCNYAGWSDSYQMGYRNGYILYFGLCADNGGESTFPFGQGWGQGPVTSTIWSEWQQEEPDDMRRQASILNVADELPGYVYVETSMEDCGLWNKKMIPILAKEALEKEGDWSKSLFWCAYDDYDRSNNNNSMQGAHYQDLISIRFADVLLMQSELKEDISGINRVRARAGLPPVGGYSLEALQKERRHELCFEGRRWADIRRWGIAEQELADKNGILMYNAGKQVRMTDGKYVSRYQATKGFFPIPKSQIDLSAGILTQNEGWTSADAYYSSWNF